MLSRALLLMIWSDRRGLVLAALGSSAPSFELVSKQLFDHATFQQPIEKLEFGDFLIGVG
jgi:hypothetical protein